MPNLEAAPPPIEEPAAEPEPAATKPQPPAPALVEAEPSPADAAELLTSREPSNPEMSNPQPIATAAPFQATPTASPTGAPRLGLLEHGRPPAPAPRARSSKKSAVIVGVSVLGSRLMGVVREQIFAFMFGASGLADAFVAAFRIPNLLRDLFAEGALSTAFTTTFTKTWEKEGPAAAWHLARLVLSTLTLVLGMICVAGVFGAPFLVHLISGGFTEVPGKFELTVRMTQLLFPFILFVSIAAAVMGMLNARGEFTVPASASTVFNIVSVIGGTALAVWWEPQRDWRHPHFGTGALFGWCFGVLLGGLAQLAMQLPALWKVGLRFKGPLYFFTTRKRLDPGLLNVLLLMVPSAIAGSAVQVNVAVNGQFASHVAGNGAVAWLYYAFRLVQLPIGLFGVAIATVTLPAVARQHALDDLKAFGKTVEEALRFGFYLTLPASIGLAVVAYPVIQLIYQHGTFSAASTQQTALALQAYTIGLAGYSGIKILVPCFYAMQPPRFEGPTGVGFGRAFAHFVWDIVLFTPARVSLIGIGVNLVLCVVLFDFCKLGHVGLAMTTGLVAVLNFLQLVHAIQKKIDLGDAREWLSFFARVTVSALACGGAVWVADSLFLADRTSSSLVGALILLANIGFGGLVYLGLTILLHVSESADLVRVIKRKLGRV